jgi:hypothetical protein
VVDRDPVEPGAEILFHLSHDVAREGTQVRELVTIFRRDNESKLVAILAAAFHERAPIGCVTVGTVEPPALALESGAVALEIPDMGVGGPAAKLEADYAGLDHDTAHSLAGLPSLRCALESISHNLATPDPGAPTLLGPRSLRSSPSLTAPLPIGPPAAAFPCGCGEHLRHEGSRLATRTRASVADTTKSWTEVGNLIVSHADTMHQEHQYSSQNRDGPCSSVEILAIFGAPARRINKHC